MNSFQKRHADVVVLTVTGRIDHETADSFQQMLDDVIKNCSSGHDQIVLDLAGVDYMSSLGLRCLMITSKAVDAQNGTFVIASLTTVLKEIFEISRFDSIFSCYENVPAALGEISSEASNAFATQ